jgi:hypothetical protein
MHFRLFVRAGLLLAAAALAAGFDVVVKCSRGDRTAKVCSTRVEAKKAQVQAVAALEPPIELRETCYQGELRNMKVRAE